MTQPQHQLDTQAIIAVGELKADLKTTRDSLDRHIDSCMNLQRGVVAGIVLLLIGMIGVLLNLYVLPRPTTTVTTEKEIIREAVPSGK